jgi:hypothetical protein
MAKVVITIEDDIKDGREIVSMSAQTDRQGLPKEAPMTTAMLHALCIIRKWNNKSIPCDTGWVCADAIQAREAAMSALARQAGMEEPTKAPPEGAAEKLKAAEIARLDQAEIAKARASATLVDAEAPDPAAA